MGAFVLYADDLAKKLMQDDAVLREKIKGVFGDQSYDADGNLNRPYLAREAFEKGRVEELNKLVHPVLWDRVTELAEEKEKEGVEVFAEEAAILLKNGRPKELDYVIIVTADEDRRIERTSKRDRTSEKEIRERMTKQPDFESLTHLADFVVLNDGTLDQLKVKAREVLKKIKSIE